MIKTAMLWVTSEPLLFGISKEARYVKFSDISYADLKNFYEIYKSTELTILLYEEPKEPLQYLCNKLLPYTEREKL